MITAPKRRRRQIKKSTVTFTCMTYAIRHQILHGMRHTLWHQRYFGYMYKMHIRLLLRLLNALSAEADYIKINGGLWMSLNYKQHCNDINKSYMCQVCLADVPAYDTAKWDNSTNVHHYWCLSDEIYRDIAKKYSIGQQRWCNTCR